MSFARFTEDCEVYVFDCVDLGLVCWNCSRAGSTSSHLVFGEAGHEALLRHLAEHRAAGDLVPAYVDKQIRGAARARRPEINPLLYDAFYSALEAQSPDVIETYFDREIDCVDGHGSEVVKALLAAGWTPPQSVVGPDPDVRLTPTLP